MKRIIRPITRRAFLQWSTALAAAPIIACAPSDGSKPPENLPPQRPTTDADAIDHAETVALDVNAIPLDATRFPMNVQAGAMTSSAVTFWTFSTEPVTLKVWRPSTEAGKVRQVHSAEHMPNDGGYVKVRVDGLAPDTLYSYAFFSSGMAARSVVGSVRTAYPEGMKWPVTIAATTCTNFRHQPYDALKLVAEEPVDMLLHVGDMSYNDGAMTLADYRERWGRTLRDEGYLAALPTTGSYITWDDHEFENDFDPERISQMQMANAKASFFEALPMEPSTGGVLWQSFRWGYTVELIVLDCRSERKPSTLETGTQEYMSQAQRDFLKQALRDSPCHFKVVLNSVPMTKFPDTFWANKPDRWQGYEASREEILDHLEEHAIDNVWFISGDFHLGFVARLEQEGFRSRLFDVAVGPGGNQGNPLAGLARMDDELKAEIFPDTQFFYGDDPISMTFLTFDPLRDVVRIRFVKAGSKEVLFDRELSRST